MSRKILGKIVIMENHRNQCILSEHKMEVDGVIYRELKSLNYLVIQDGPDAGKEEQVLVHIRSIKLATRRKQREFTLQVKLETEEVVEENNMTSLEFEAFQEEWNKNWNPSLGQQIEQEEVNKTSMFKQEEVNKTSMLKGFFKKLLLKKFDNLTKK